MAAKILILDDNKTQRASIAGDLRANGHVVVEAAEYEHAFSLLSGELFDLIVLDISPPGKSAFRILDFLKTLEVTSKVIVITGTLDLESAIKRPTRGARGYVIKPYNQQYLIKTIEHLIADQSRTSLRIQIVKAGDFLKSTPTGELDLEASVHGLAQIAEASANLESYGVLIDLRDVRSKLPRSDIFDLGYNLVQYGETFRRKTAVLAREDEDLKQAKLFEDVAQHRGFGVRAFTVFEDAMAWLSTITELTEVHLNGHSSPTQ